MLYAMLLLGLIPAVLLPDFLAEQDDELDDEPFQHDSQDAPVSLLDDPDEAALEEEPEPGHAAAADSLDPVIEDDILIDTEPGDDGLPPVIEEDQQEDELVVLDPLIEDDMPPAEPPEITGEVLAPVIEDDSDEGYPDPDEAEILTPVIEDDVAVDDPDEEPLAPVIEDDPAMAEDGERSDPLAEDNNADTAGTWLNANDLASGGYAEISGFDVGTDVLQVSLDPGHGLPDLTVASRPSEDGADSEILIGDRLVAMLKDAPDVPVEDIVLTIQRLA